MLRRPLVTAVEGAHPGLQDQYRATLRAELEEDEDPEEDREGEDFPPSG